MFKKITLAAATAVISLSVFAASASAQADTPPDRIATNGIEIIIGGFGGPFGGSIRIGGGGGGPAGPGGPGGPGAPGPNGTDLQGTNVDGTDTVNVLDIELPDGTVAQVR